MKALALGSRPTGSQLSSDTYPSPLSHSSSNCSLPLSLLVPGSLFKCWLLPNMVLPIRRLPWHLIWKHTWIKVKGLSLSPTAMLSPGTGAGPALNVPQWMRQQFWKSVYRYICVCSCWIWCLLCLQLHRHIWTHCYRHNGPVGQLAMEIKCEVMGPVLATSLTQSKSFTREP